jgi:hypothetical protein
MPAEPERGRIYRCPVCGAELLTLASTAGDFAPRCCNVDMVLLDGRVVFYRCVICGAELAVLREGAEGFLPRCGNEDMVRQAA